MVERWGVETTRRFFARCCPLLLELGAVAYWSVSLSPDLAALRSAVVDITQCVLALDDHRLRVVKADGRMPGIEGTVYAYLGGTSLRIAPATSRLAAALKSVREARGLSQTELARVAGVSPSAISHAERAQSGLSLDTLVDLAGRLGVSLDDLLRGSDGPGYRLARRLDPRERSAGGALPLLDDAGVGMRIVLVRLRAASRERRRSPTRASSRSPSRQGSCRSASASATPRCAPARRWWPSARRSAAGATSATARPCSSGSCATERGSTTTPASTTNRPPC